MGLKRLVRAARARLSRASSSTKRPLDTTPDPTPHSPVPRSPARELPVDDAPLSATSSSLESNLQPVPASTIVLSIPELRDLIFTFHAYHFLERYLKLTRPLARVTPLNLLQAHLELWHVDEVERLREDWFEAHHWPRPRPRPIPRMRQRFLENLGYINDEEFLAEARAKEKARKERRRRTREHQLRRRSSQDFWKLFDEGCPTHPWRHGRGRAKGSEGQWHEEGGQRSRGEKCECGNEWEGFNWSRR